MRTSFFTKNIVAKGTERTVKGQVIATMNYKLKTVVGTHAVTHDDFKKNIPVHKVEIIIEGFVFQKSPDLNSEEEVYNESKKMIEIATQQIQKMADEKQTQTFVEKMQQLFT